MAQPASVFLRRSFDGSAFLFEHHGRRYERTGISARVTILGKTVIAKKISPHMIRHAVGTLWSGELGIKKAADFLGHENISTTQKFYDHTHVTDQDFLKLVT